MGYLVFFVLYGDGKSPFGVFLFSFMGPLCFDQYERTLIRERYLNTKKERPKTYHSSRPLPFIDEQFYDMLYCQ